MAHARQADRATAQVPIFFGAALIAAAVLSITLALSGSFSIGGGIVNPISQPVIGPNDPVWRAAEDWEQQRRQQSAYVDPVLKSADDWEYQRRQQSPYVDRAARSAEEWERQRHQQSGY